MLQKDGACTDPRRGDGMPRGGKRKTAEPSEDDQYSDGNSSVVTLRSHSVMIQSFRPGAI